MYLNQKPVIVNQVVHTDDLLVIEELNVEKFELHSISVEPEILYEDEDVVVVNKPSGMPSHPSHHHLEDDMGTLLRNYYQDEHFVIRPIGRLDKDVSGIMIYAKNQLAAARLTAQRKDGILQKEYYAIVEGQLDSYGILSFSLKKETGKMAQAFNQGGRDCVTEYEVIKRYSTECLIKVCLKTGRTHQIRAGFAGIGHPLLGDTLYGGNTDRINRPALHCARVKFLQPFSKEKLELEIALAEDMKRK
jgi:rluD1